MSKNKLEGWWSIFIPFVLCIVTWFIIQMTKRIFGEVGSINPVVLIVEVVVLTVGLFFAIKKLSDGERFADKPDAYGDQKIYSASTFTYVVTGVGLALNIWSALS